VLGAISAFGLGALVLAGLAAGAVKNVVLALWSAVRAAVGFLGRCVSRAVAWLISLIPEGEAGEILGKLGDIPVFTGGAEALRNLTNIPMTRGLLVCFKRPELKSVQEIMEGCRRIAVLENVTNPTNVGAIFRSAAALGMDAVLLNKACSDPFYRRASRVAMGTTFQVPWTYADNDHYIDHIKELGFRTAAMALRRDTVSIRDPKLKALEKLAIVLGAEGEGLSDETIDSCDYTIKIPMAHGVDSLNVAACSAVAFWELSSVT
jgi:tRNA G18 (ribose-2'-O)-methylase SpoU